jgi:ABC-type lipoprotein export system ATPase subunit
MVTHNPRIASEATREIHLTDGIVLSIVDNGKHRSAERQE